MARVAEHQKRPTNTVQMFTHLLKITTCKETANTENKQNFFIFTVHKYNKKEFWF